MKEVTKLTKVELMTKLKALTPADKSQRNQVVCALIGHSNIVTTFFGYVYCGRCSDQIGDSLGGAYSNKDAVIVGHNCETCQRNSKFLTWRDRLYAPNPTKEPK